MSCHIPWLLNSGILVCSWLCFWKFYLFFLIYHDIGIVDFFNSSFDLLELSIFDFMKSGIDQKLLWVSFSSKYAVLGPSGISRTNSLFQLMRFTDVTHIKHIQIIYVWSNKNTVHSNTITIVEEIAIRFWS